MPTQMIHFYPLCVTEINYSSIHSFFRLATFCWSTQHFGSSLQTHISTQKEVNKKFNHHQIIVIGFPDCISARAFCLFCSLHGLFTCMKPKLAQIKLVNIIQTKRRQDSEITCRYVFIEIALNNLVIG